MKSKIKQWFVRKFANLGITCALVFSMFGISWLVITCIALIDVGISSFNWGYNKILKKKDEPRVIGIFEDSLGSIAEAYGRCIDLVLEYVEDIYNAVEDNNKREKMGWKTV